MILPKDIMIEIYKCLKSFKNPKFEVGFQRTDFEHNGIAILVIALDGEGSVRKGRANVNIYVKDLTYINGNSTFHTPNKLALEEIRESVVNKLKHHVSDTDAMVWQIGNMNGIMENVQTELHEHFVSVPLDITIYERNN